MKNNSIKKRQFSDYPTFPKKKKKFGQHFLRKPSVVNHMIDRVTITPETSVLEIGCGDGFLTRVILEQTKCKQLWGYEIDPEWVNILKEKIKDPRFKLCQENILQLDFTKLEPYKPWVLLSNLPYQITFPILFLLQKHKDLFTEGVVMVQEEVAQKIVASYGRGFSTTSIFLQYNFEFELMEKVEPEAFSPPPKVYSRLIYFKTKKEQIKIDQEEDFWKFLKLCFIFPRRTLANNLRTTHYDLTKIPQETLQMRAQQLGFNDFLNLWEKIKK